MLMSKNVNNDVSKDSPIVFIGACLILNAKMLFLIFQKINQKISIH